MKTTNNNTVEQAAGRKQGLLGIYVIKSPYHKKEFFLPFLILSYSESENKYNVLTIEYRGLTAYRVNGYYSKKSILEYVQSNLITKICTPGKFSENQRAKDLMNQYYNAKNQ